MLINNLERIVQLGRDRNISQEYIKIELKEALIYYALDFIYNSPKWNKLIFGGGTALKIIGKTARLSEDLDMDYLEENFDSDRFLTDLIKYFKQLGFDDLGYASKQNGKLIILKFPVLKKLGIIENIRSESDLLYLKIEIEKNKYSVYDIKATPIARDNLFFIIRNYDLETLFANKIGAILGRKDKVFQDKFDFKGRDFYDLIWFLENGIKPNLKRVQQIIKAEQNKTVKSYDDIWKLIRERTENINTKGIYEDMKNLIESPEGIKQLSNNYLEIYDNLVKKIG
ncbi:MAG: nucleotidyl transferase AbiEii/AbiGii toxin family protein [Candidatus Pacebacteria bacterium]|nr:nucleotidyl transferase AbiEii/AbiGii toxin family protein [Candidatus Paceibacterota bacterium]